MQLVAYLATIDVFDEIVDVSNAGCSRDLGPQGKVWLPSLDITLCSIFDIITFSFIEYFVEDTGRVKRVIIAFGVARLLP